MIVIYEVIEGIKVERYFPNNKIVEVHVILNDADGVEQMIFYHEDGRNFNVRDESAQASWDANEFFLTNVTPNSDLPHYRLEV